MRVGGMEEQIEWWRPATAGQDDSGGSGTSVFSLASSVIRKLNHMRYCKKQKQKNKTFFDCWSVPFPLSSSNLTFFLLFFCFHSQVWTFNSRVKTSWLRMWRLVGAASLSLQSDASTSREFWVILFIEVTEKHCYLWEISFWKKVN